jgi:hypothetical protein
VPSNDYPHNGSDVLQRGHLVVVPFVAKRGVASDSRQKAAVTVEQSNDVVLQVPDDVQGWHLLVPAKLQERRHIPQELPQVVALFLDLYVFNW